MRCYSVVRVDLVAGTFGNVIFIESQTANVDYCSESMNSRNQHVTCRERTGQLAKSLVAQTGMQCIRV